MKKYISILLLSFVLIFAGALLKINNQSLELSNGLLIAGVIIEAIGIIGLITLLLKNNK